MYKKRNEINAEMESLQRDISITKRALAKLITKYPDSIGPVLRAETTKEILRANKNLKDKLKEDSAVWQDIYDTSGKMVGELDALRCRKEKKGCSGRAEFFCETSDNKELCNYVRNPKQKDNPIKYDTNI